MIDKIKFEEDKLKFLHGGLKIKTNPAMNLRESDLSKIHVSSSDTAARLAIEAVNIPAIVDTPWIITSEPATVKPTVEEELSKIHEELACMNKTINKVRHESTKKDETIDMQQKEITKLKSKLKKEKTKSKSKDETIETQQIQLNDQQSQIDKLELRMNDVENDYSVRSEYK